MPLSDDNPSYRIDSLASISQVAVRLVDCFRKERLDLALILAEVPREQLAADVLRFVVDTALVSSLGRALVAPSRSPVNTGSREFFVGEWATNPFHCGGCAGSYQRLLNEVVNLAVSSNASDSLTNELATYDHIRLSRFIGRTRLTWPFRFDAIFDYLGKKNTSAASTIIRELLADAKLHHERQLELQRTDLIRRIESTLSNLAQHVDEMSPEQLQSALAEIFIKGREEVSSYLSWKISWDNETIAGNLFERLQSVCPPAHPILPAALRLVNSTNDWPLISTLLMILRRDSHSCPDLMAAALAQKKRAAVLELINHGAPPPAGPASPPPEQHLERLRNHAEYNEARCQYLLQLDAMTPQERLRRIALDDQWPVAAYPISYADVDATLSLPEALRDRLKVRLLSAPRGAWTKFRTQLSEEDASRE